MLAEYQEPLARFRREQIQDTVVFFGSARFQEAQDAGRISPPVKESTPPWQQPNCRQDLKRAQAVVDMARYYEDARRLAYMLTEWSTQIPARPPSLRSDHRRRSRHYGRANLGAYEAGGKSIGLNINCRSSRYPNPYITPALNFEFHYFFMRKFWFAYLAKALVIFPGVSATLDELFEILTLAQTEKLAKKIFVVIYGSEYWNRCRKLSSFRGCRHCFHLNTLSSIVDQPARKPLNLRDGLTEFHLAGTPKRQGEAFRKLRNNRIEGPFCLGWLSCCFTMAGEPASLLHHARSAVPGSCQSPLRVLERS